jgi:hypothetical protein
LGPEAERFASKSVAMMFGLLKLAAISELGCVEERLEYAQGEGETGFLLPAFEPRQTPRTSLVLRGPGRRLRLTRFRGRGGPLVWRHELQPPFRSKQEVIINATLEAVWSFSMDLTRIPEFHPRVVKVDLLSGKTFREPGASYQCHLAGGKHTCIEKDIEIIPLQKIVTVLPEDTFGISKILSDYRVETAFQRMSDQATKVEISHYYSTKTLKAKFLNLIAKGKIARDTQATLNAAKSAIEASCPTI